MSTSSDYSKELLAEIAPVADALSAVVPPKQMMLVGAQCRNLLHSRLVGGAPRRRTNDTDIAIAISDWAEFADVRDQFESVGDSGHRFRINGILTDVIPFGEVESPLGTSTHPPGHSIMNVHGFRDAFARADKLPVTGEVTIMIPRVENYAVLKTHAWLDRSANGDYRDGEDLALSVYWFFTNTDLLYSEANTWALEAHDHELRRAAAALLGATMRQALSSDEREALSARVAVANTDRLARHFGVGEPGWPSTDSTRLPVVLALFNELASA